MFANLIANNYKLHVIINGMVTFWLISTSIPNRLCACVLFGKGTSNKGKEKSRYTWA